MDLWRDPTPRHPNLVWAVLSSVGADRSEQIAVRNYLVSKRRVKILIVRCTGKHVIICSNSRNNSPSRSSALCEIFRALQKCGLCCNGKFLTSEIRAHSTG